MVAAEKVPVRTKTFEVAPLALCSDDGIEVDDVSPEAFEISLPAAPIRQHGTCRQWQAVERVSKRW